ncbi:hypothetical protein C8F04DRAFT_1190145 [Mycena alexandri]|uniref:Uncharacterized protein n=1 Tax=Mycena alexandri TaxID=1745969 RepID=A0AAD6SFC0_9AGAR|nr:hypothetical protein C8F04DRAFT_1190145 [Mycena alexandri]
MDHGIDDSRRFHRGKQEFGLEECLLEGQKSPKTTGRQPQSGRIKTLSLPSECKLAVALTRYCPPTWRGRDPDPNRVVPDPHLVLEGSTQKEISAAVARCTKYYDFLCLQSTKLHESLSDLIEKRGWDDKPPTCIKKLLAQAPEEVWRALTECAELKLGLAEQLSKALLPRILRTCAFFPQINTAALELRSLTLELSKRKSLQNLGHLWSLVEHILPPLISELRQLAASLPKEPASEQSIRGCSARGRGENGGGARGAQGQRGGKGGRGGARAEQTSLDGFLQGGVQTMAGISSQLAKFGVAKKKDLKSTDWSGIDAMEETGMEWIGVEFDARDLILNLKSCYLEVELLLHTTPQIYTTKQWLGVARTPDSKRGFKVVIALEFKTHVLAFLSRDNNARVYWLSIPDMKATNRVPDIVLDFWGWSEFTVKWLEERGAKDDKKSAGSVLSEAGNHPGRGISRYMRNETLNLAGLPPETLWGKIRKDPRKLAQVVTALRYVRMSQTLNTQYGFSVSCCTLLINSDAENFCPEA